MRNINCESEVEAAELIAGMDPGETVILNGSLVTYDGEAWEIMLPGEWEMVATNNETGEEHVIFPGNQN